MRREIRIMFALLFLAAFNTVLPQPIHAQSTQQAKAYYFLSETAYQEGNYRDAYEHLKKAEELRGATDEVFLALEVKILTKQKKYTAARRALNQFYSYDPSTELQREMAPFLATIDREIAVEKRRLAKANAEREARLQRERNERRAEAKRKADIEARRVAAQESLDAFKIRMRTQYDAACISAAGCLAAVKDFDRDVRSTMPAVKPVLRDLRYDQEVLAKLFHLFRRGCVGYNNREACKMLNRNGYYWDNKTPADLRFEALKRECTQAQVFQLYACGGYGMMLANLEDYRFNKPIPFDRKKGLALMHRSCMEGEGRQTNGPLPFCFLLYRTYTNKKSNLRFVTIKSKKKRRAYAQRICQITNGQRCYEYLSKGYGLRQLYKIPKPPHYYGYW